MRPLSRTLWPSSALLTLLVAAPLHATHELVVLPGGAEVCLNGARFVGKVFLDAGTVLGFPVSGSVSFLASDPVTHTFSTVGESHVFEVRYPASTFLVGDPALLHIEAPSASFGEPSLPVESCTLIESGDFLEP